MQTDFTIPFAQISNRDVALVGGKNASLGEMFNNLSAKGILVPNGFATTAEAFRYFLRENKLEAKVTATLSKLDAQNFSNLPQIGQEARRLMAEAKMPEALAMQIKIAYNELSAQSKDGIAVAVRSSATAEDLPTASFAGQHESFLNIIGADAVVDACHRCYISLFHDRAIKYRIDNHFEHMQVALSCGVQKMVRSDLGAAGVAFTLDPESGFREVIYITGAWGLGENVVQGAVGPDEFLVFKPDRKSVV